MPFAMTSATTRGLAAVCAAALVLASACGSGNSSTESGSGGTRVFAADNGKIKIPAEPKRVVATGYAVPVLIELGAPLVGISTWKRGIPMMSAEDRATYEKLDKVAGESAAETNYEAVAKADPDLIVIGVPKPVLGDLNMKRLESVAPVVVLGPASPSDWRDLSRRQAEAVGSVEGYGKAKAEYERKAATIAAKYKGALAGLKFGHVGGYGKVASGTFMREYARSWGTNVAGDIGVPYYGEVKEKRGGGTNVSEYPSIEKLSESLGEADVITYTLEPDGTVGPAVKYVLDSDLWKRLPAVKAGRAYGIRYTQAATYPSALKTLDALDQALAPLLKS
ncbi:ABC transporter substrate-binding protein [Actinomadura spongiicola]|nr:ABC transporter substrate-binding protein [Actinomadura spongiicola]